MAQEKISACDDWYSNKKTDFHSRTNLNGITINLDSLNFAKRLCADDANLCEIIEINAGKNENQFKGVLDILEKNRFDSQYRRQLEKMSASGTVGGYIRLDNADLLADGTVKHGDIRINYVEAENIIPMTVINGDVTECAFSGEDLVSGKKQGTLVIFKLENGLYTANTYFFEDDKHVSDRDTSLQLGNVRPFFIMQTAEVNNLDDMDGYGYEVFDVSFITDDGIYYTMDQDDEVCDLYLNDEKLDSDVKTYSTRKDDNTVYYIVDPDDGEGTLKRTIGGKSVKIADDVAEYSSDESGDVVFLSDYNFKKYRGDLSLFSNNKIEKIDTDVTSIVYFK